MSETKWTPGPWTAVFKYQHWAIVADRGGSDIYNVATTCNYCGPGEATIPNAFLIASAPELYKALSNLAHEIRYMLRTNPEKDGGMYRQRLTEAEVALERARRGEG
jgi:hypothetical protein